MENKQSFGAFICQRRKELELTQKEFARRLYVTDSAVSKWERGLAYPDITLLQDICRVLQISEKELLSASEDTEGRRVEQLAKKYLRLTRNYRVTQYILYGLSLLACLICNLAVQHTLSWFWIVLASELTAASLTLLPALAPEGRRGLWSLAGFTGSLILLLAVCCLYSGGDWFFLAASAILFGMGLVFLPFVLGQFLPEQYRRLRFPLYVAAETVLLLILLAFCQVFGGGSWYPTAAAGLLFGAGLVFGPAILPKLPLPAWLQNRKFTLYIAIETLLLLILLAVDGLFFPWYPPAAVGILFGVGLVFGPFMVRQLPLEGHRGLAYAATETALLLLLYGTYCLSYGQSWFVSASVWTVFGLSITVLPFVIRQLPLPENFRHKALAWMAVCSVLLLLGLAWESVFPQGLAIALVCLALPWGWLGCLRYLPVNRWLRAAAAFFWTGLWGWLFPWSMDRILMASGRQVSHPYDLRLPVDLFNWQDSQITSANIIFLILAGFGLLGVICTVIGLRKSRA